MPKKRKVDKSKNVYARVRTIKPTPSTYIRVGVKRKKGKKGGRTVALAPQSYQPALKKGISPVQKTKKIRKNKGR